MVRSDNGGADNFGALGVGGNGVQVATPTSVFSNNSNTSLTVGQERTGSDNAIAVDPNNAAHVIAAFSDAPGANGAGVLQVVVSESFDSGATWAIKFTTDAATRSDQPAVAISTTGAIGLLYDNYDPATNHLSQHIVSTTNDFATTTNTTLATETNATPPNDFFPYLGDFFDLQAVGNTFYGIFSASNADNGTDAQFSNLVMGRNFSGNLGTSSFHLLDASGNPLAASIDPYFFTYQLGNSFGHIFLYADSGASAYWDTDQNVRQGPGSNLPFTGPTWHERALIDYDNRGPDFSDVLWQNNNGAVAIWQMQGTNPVNQNNLGQNPGPTWHVTASGDFDGNTVSDVLLQNNNGALALWELQNSAGGPQILSQFDIGQNPGPTWHAVTAADFNDDGRAGILFRNDNGATAIWEMNPTGPAIGPNGTFNDQGNLPSTGTTWHPITAADFNGDGRADILWQNDNGSMAIWEMNDTAPRANGQFNIDGSQFFGPAWHAVAARDFNNDGRADILLQNDNGATALWENFTEGSGGRASFTVQLDIAPQPNNGHLDWHIA